MLLAHGGRAAARELELLARIETFEGASYGWVLFETVAVVALVALVGYVVLRLLAPRASAQRGPIRILARLPIEPRRTLYLIGVGERVWLVGASEGAFSTLAELDPSARAALAGEPPEPADFASLLAERLLKRRSAAAPLLQTPSPHGDVAELEEPQ